MSRLVEYGRWGLSVPLALVVAALDALWAAGHQACRTFPESFGAITEHNRPSRLPKRGEERG
jgi:hypothetical protein